MCVEAHNHSLHAHILSLGVSRHEQEKAPCFQLPVDKSVEPLFHMSPLNGQELLRSSKTPCCAGRAKSQSPWLVKGTLQLEYGWGIAQDPQGPFILSSLPAQLTQLCEASRNARLSVWSWSPLASSCPCAVGCSPETSREKGPEEPLPFLIIC